MTGYLNVPAALAVIVPVTAVCLTFVAFVYSPNAAALTDSVTGRAPTRGPAARGASEELRHKKPPRSERPRGLSSVGR